MAKRTSQSSKSGSIIVNILIVAVSVVVLFLGWSFVSNLFFEPSYEGNTENRGRTASGEVIQLDVLNGCGSGGVAQKFTDFLRKRNFDVVQSSNYKTFDVEHSLVIDRIGDTETAKKVARVLGIDESRILQQINPDYYIHVSVVIGRDYPTLKPYE